jgi:hypothetical protein
MVQQRNLIWNNGSGISGSAFDGGRDMGLSFRR